MADTQRPVGWRRARKGLALGFAALALLVAGLLSARYSGRTPSQTAADKRPVLEDERQPFFRRYGAPRYSSHEEELFVRDFFSDKRDGVFVDVGASHYRDRSNTYFLEAELGWSGLAIEPIVDFAAGYREHRPKTKFIPMFVSDKSDAEAKLYVGENSLFSSADQKFTDSFTNVTRAITARTITLNDLLAAEGITRFDFLSMDIELHEPQALAGFDVERFKPALVCIEAHPQVRQQILDYFTTRGYVVVGRYLRADPQNLWFRPIR